MSISIKSGTSTDVATVDSDKQLLVNLPKDPTLSGTVRILSADGDAIDVTENNALRVSSANIIFYDQVDGSTVNTNLWNPTVSGMTITNAGGFYNVNAGAAMTAGAYAILPSIKALPLYGTLPLKVEFNAKTVNLPEANCTAEIGIGTVSAASAPTDGAFFRWNAAGQFVCVINNGGAETLSAALTGTITDTDGVSTIAMPPVTAVIHLYAIEIVEDRVLFFVDDIQVAGLTVPSGQAFPFASGRQVLAARVWNGTTPSSGATLSIGQVVVKQEDLNQNKGWFDVLASLGRGSYQSPVSAFGQTANHANSTSPASATLSNTAAGYTTLGGRFQFAAVGGAATDFAIFAYQVPAGFQLFVNAVAIACLNTGAIGGLTGTILDWGLGVNASTVSLATADGAGTWAPRRIPLGLQAFAISAAIGTQPADIVRRFDTPIVIDSGRFLHVILQIPVGLATASQILRGTVTINGCLE